MNFADIFTTFRPVRYRSTSNRDVPACESYVLPSSMRLARSLRRQMGDYAFTRHLRNLGLDFTDAYILMFGKLP